MVPITKMKPFYVCPDCMNAFHKEYMPSEHFRNDTKCNGNPQAALLASDIENLIKARIEEVKKTPNEEGYEVSFADGEFFALQSLLAALEVGTNEKA